MTIPVWPSGLSPVQAQGYRETQQPNTIRSEVAAGPAKVRRRFTAAVRVLDVTWAMTAEQLKTFQAFFDDDLASGSLEFLLPSPRYGLSGTGNTVRARFLVEGGAYNVAYNAEQRAWQVTARLELLPSPEPV